MAQKFYKFHKLPMQKLIGATEVRNHFGSHLNRVFRGEEHLVIEKLGMPVAALISMKDYEQYRHYLAQQLHKDLGRKLGAEADKQGLTEEALIASMEEDRQAVYEEMYGATGSKGKKAKAKAE
jgi:prevent-host-death family protein